VLSGPEGLFEVRDEPHNALSRGTFRDFLDALLELAEIRLSCVNLGGGGDEDEPALVSEPAKDVCAHQGLADSVLADEESRARPTLAAERRFKPFDGRGAVADGRQRRNV